VGITFAFLPEVSATRRRVAVGFFWMRTAAATRRPSGPSRTSVNMTFRSLATGIVAFRCPLAAS